MGVLPHSALQTEDGISAAFTIDDLIRMSTLTIDVSQNRFGFSLHSAMAVDSLIRDSPLGGRDAVANAMQGEVVSYAIVNRAFTKFQDGTNQTFTLAITSHVNASGFTRTDDAFC